MAIGGSRRCRRSAAERAARAEQIRRLLEKLHALTRRTSAMREKTSALDDRVAMHLLHLRELGVGWETISRAAVPDVEMSPPRDVLRRVSQVLRKRLSRVVTAGHTICGVDTAKGSTPVTESDTTGGTEEEKTMGRRTMGVSLQPGRGGSIQIKPSGDIVGRGDVRVEVWWPSDDDPDLEPALNEEVDVEGDEWAAGDVADVDDLEEEEDEEENLNEEEDDEDDLEEDGDDVDEDDD